MWLTSSWGNRPARSFSAATGAISCSANRRTVSLAVDGLRRGRVYELFPEKVKSSEGDAVLHPEAYYTLNELP